MERKIIATIGIDDDTADEKIHDGPVPYLEKEMGQLQQSGITLRECFIADEDESDKWQAYLNYLVNWAFEHQGEEFAGMTPAGYNEWLTNEGAATTISRQSYIWYEQYEENFTKDMAGCSLDHVLTEASRMYSFADCTGIEVIEVVHEGKKYFYEGWEPGMQFIFRNSDHDIVWNRSFPQWDH